MTGNGSPSSWSSGHVPANSLTETAFSREADTSAAGRSGVSNAAASHQGTPNFPVLDASSQHCDDPPYVPPRIAQAELSYPALDPRIVTVTPYSSPNQHQYPYDNVTNPLDSIEAWSTSSSSPATSQDLDHVVNKFSQAPLPQRQTGYYPAYEGQHRHGLEHIKYGGYPSNTGGSYYRNLPHGPSMISPETFDAQFHYPATSSQASSSSINRPHTLPMSFAQPVSVVNDVTMSTDPTGTYLRQQLGIQAHEAISLWSLPEPPAGEKPTTPLPMLVKLAIYGSPKKRLTLQEIYAELENRFQWYRDHKHETAWKNSIRHNLSLNKVFVHVPRPITEPGKGNYWQLDVSGGEGYKRARKRRPKNKRIASDEEEEEISEIDEERPSSSHRAELRSTPVEDANIDPELRGEGHVVGEHRTRSGTRRVGTSGGSPYPQQSPRYQYAPLPAVAGEQQTNVGPRQPSVRFGQPSFGEVSFPPFAQGGTTAAVASSTLTSAPLAAPGSASAPMIILQTTPAASHPKDHPVTLSSYDFFTQAAVQPTQRPVVEYTKGSGVLPTALRIPTTLSPNPQGQSPGNSSVASPGSVSSGSSRTWNDAGSRSQAQG